MKTDEFNFDKQLEELGIKSVKLAEKTITEMKPKVNNLMNKLSAWLDKKLGL